MVSYDEDLSENPIFKRISEKFPHIINAAPSKSLLVCVPKKIIALEILSSLQEKDFLNYILKPQIMSPENSPEMQNVITYFTMTKRKVEFKEGCFQLKQGFNEQKNIKVLFEETFYNSDDKSYQVLCIDQPFEGKSTNQTVLKLEELLQLDQCYNFLLLGGHIHLQVMEQHINTHLNTFLHSTTFKQGVSLRYILDKVSRVITKIIRTCLKYSKIHRKYREDKSYIDVLRLAVENVVFHQIYDDLFKVVCGLVSQEDAELNKATRNLAHIEPGDLEIKSFHCFNFPKVKGELQKIATFRTPFQKLYCLNRTFKLLSQPLIQSQEPLSADELLPLLVLLVIHSDIPCWYGILTYMQSFHLSQLDRERHKYCVSSLEAALEFLRNGNLTSTGSIKPWFVQSECNILSPLTSTSRSIDNTRKITQLFELIQEGNITELQERLELAYNTQLAKLCHPLCDCETCRVLVPTTSQRSIGAATLSSCDDWGRTSLHIAALMGDENIIELLINNGAQLDSQDYHGSTALHMSCQKGHINPSMLLVDRGAPVSIQDNDGNTPLHLACLYGHEQCLKALIFQSSDRKLNAYNEKGDTPLHIAARWGYENMVRLLLESGASAEARNKEKQLPTSCAQNSNVIAIFTHHSLSTDPLRRQQLEGSKNKTEISRISYYSFEIPISPTSPVRTKYNPSNVQQSKSNNLEIDIMLLFDAIKMGNERLVLEMMGWGEYEAIPANESAMNITNSTSSIVESSCKSLHYRELFNRVENCCHPLCRCKKCNNLQVDETVFNANLTSKSGQTILHCASMYGHLALVELFLSKGADLNARTLTNKNTPLHLACQYNHTSIVHTLIQHGADLNWKNVNGNSPLHFCASNGHKESGECLLFNGANPDSNNHRGDTPLHNAAKWGNICMVLCLLAYGSQADIVNANNLMPIQLTQTDEVITLLESIQSSKLRLSTTASITTNTAYITSNSIQIPSTNSTLTITSPTPMTSCNDITASLNDSSADYAPPNECNPINNGYLSVINNIPSLTNSNNISFVNKHNALQRTVDINHSNNNNTNNNNNNNHNNNNNNNNHNNHSNNNNNSNTNNKNNNSNNKNKNKININSNNNKSKIFGRYNSNDQLNKSVYDKILPFKRTSTPPTRAHSMYFHNTDSANSNHSSAKVGLKGISTRSSRFSFRNNNSNNNNNNNNNKLEPEVASTLYTATNSTLLS